MLNKLLPIILDKIVRNSIRISCLVSTAVLSYILIPPQELTNVTFAFPFEIGGFTLKAALWCLASLAICATVHVLLCFYIEFRVETLVGPPEEKKKDLLELLELLDCKSGIKKIYPGKKGASARSQLYAQEVIKSLEASESIKMICIAGYEYIGKGIGSSLLLNALNQHQLVNIEVITINPDSMEIISDRIKQIKRSYPDYTPTKMKNEITATTNTLKGVVVNRENVNDGDVSLFYTKNHPIFRLLIFDTCLFLGTYEINHHGHESPVYKIEKINDSDTANNLSLYDSFVKYYDLVKQSSDKVNLAQQD